MQVKLFVEASVGVIEELLAVFAPLVTLHVLEAAQAGAKEPHPPGLSVRVVEHRLRSQRLLEHDVRLLLRVADVAVGPLGSTQVDLTHK